MIDAATQSLLRDIVRREGRSLLQYVRDAFPWISAREPEALPQLHKLTDEELEAAAALNQFLIRHRVTPPYLGAYPMAFTNINYVSLDHLLPQLVDYERRAIADLERDLGKLSQEAARAQVQQLLEMKQRHLKTLESLATAHPDTVATKM